MRVLNGRVDESPSRARNARSSLRDRRQRRFCRRRFCKRRVCGRRGSGAAAAAYQHALATGFDRAFLVAAGIALLILVIAIAAIRVRRADLSGATH